MILQNSIIGASRADSFGRRGQRSSIGDGGSALSPTALNTPPRMCPSSAFSAPSSSHHHHSGVAIAAAAYESPPKHHYETMMQHSVHGLRLSPTSVMADAVYGGGLGGVPYDYTSSLQIRSSGYYYDTPVAAATGADGYHHYAHGEPLDPAMVKTAAVCRPYTQPPVQVQATAARNTDHAMIHSSSPTRGDGRLGSINQGPNISAGDVSSEFIPTPPLFSSGSGARTPSDISESNQPTPQNLRDNPERLAKVKSEMCHFYEKGGVERCPYGKNCNYAHGKHELKFRYTTLCLMESAGQITNGKTYLARPCQTWVSTGACPFGRRCAAIHDPTVAGHWEHPSWLPAATANTNAQVIIDQLAVHRDNAVHQANPLIAQSIWENCRPSRPTHRNRHNERAESSSSSDANKRREWADTYALVSNSGISSFTGGITHSNASSKKLSDLQKLCIVRLLRSGDGLSLEKSSSQLHRDYVFSPTHSLYSELCMILQARYFLLLDIDFTSAADVSPEDTVKEISFDEYTSYTTPWSETDHPFDPSRCVTAHEVTFAPKGDHSANLSIWFDTLPVKLVQSQIKRSRRIKQKKKTHIRNEHTGPNANGALLNRTTTADFPTGRPDIDPFVPMLPADDHEDSHNLIMAIIEHRINSIILSNCSSVDAEQKKKLHMRMKQLQKAFMGMAKFQEKWTWPKREGMDHLTRFTNCPPGNIMPYIPSKTHKKSPCIHTWHSFVKTIGTLNTDVDHLSSNDDAKRLSVFLSFDGSAPRTSLGGNTKRPPHIIADMWWNAEASSPKKDGTWKEILLGLPENGKWEAALRLHKKKKEGSIDNTTIKSRNMPLSTIPFVQP